MSQKIFLTSALAMGVIAPAIAEPERIATFPNAANNEFMQENKVYTNAATETNMVGVYQDGATVDAVAQYTDILYNIVAGNYLAAGSDATNGTQCPAGSYCPGLTNATYDEDNDQGINSCPNEYGLSATGASSQNDCYRTCTTADVEHSAGVTGGYYYGNNNQCGATSCVNGWHLKEGLDLAEKLATHNPNNSGTNTYAYFGSTGGGGVMPSSYYGLNQYEWAVSLNDLNNFGDIRGRSICSTETGDNQGQTWTNTTVFQDLTDERGMSGAINCYCNVTGYRENNTSEWQAVTSPWVFVTRNYGGPMTESQCSDMCAKHCAFDTKGGNNGLKFTNALLSTVEPSLAMCEANVININWNDVDPATAGQNNENTATYGSDVRTPVKATTKKGKTFRGWRFSKPTETNLP